MQGSSVGESGAYRFLHEAMIAEGLAGESRNTQGYFYWLSANYSFELIGATGFFGSLPRLKLVAAGVHATSARLPQQSILSMKPRPQCGTALKLYESGCFVVATERKLRER